MLNTNSEAMMRVTSKTLKEGDDVLHNDAQPGIHSVRNIL